VNKDYRLRSWKLSVYKWPASRGGPQWQHSLLVCCATWFYHYGA